MANIRVDIEHTLIDGDVLTFRAPCDSASVTGIKVYYPNESGTLQAKEFAFKDCHGNTLESFENLFKSGVYVKVILNTGSAEAYIQNADTNAYLEGRFSGLKSVKVNLTLTASGWSGNVYTISNSNITATCPVELLPREGNGATTEQVEALVYALIVGGTQAAGSIQLVAHGDVPTVDIPVTLIIRRDL